MMQIDGNQNGSRGECLALNILIRESECHKFCESSPYIVPKFINLGRGKIKNLIGLGEKMTSISI